MTTSIGFDIFAKDRASGSFRNVGNEAEKSMGKLHSFAKTAGGVFTGLLAGEAAAKVGEFLKGSVEAAAADQTAQVRLGLALKNTTHATKDQIASTEEWITKQSLATGNTKADLMPAFQKLAESTGSVTKAQKEMKLAMDVSAGTGRSLSSVSLALAKANNGSLGGLSRFGIKTQQVTKDTAALQSAQIGVKSAQLALNSAIKSYGPHSTQASIATGKLKLAQEAVGAAQAKTKKTTISLHDAIKSMGNTFGGQAKVQAATMQGQMKRLGAQWEEIKVQVGNRLMPVLLSFGNWFFHQGVPAIKQFAAEFQNGVGVAGKLHMALSATFVALKAFGGFLMNHKAVLVGVVAAWAAWRVAVMAHNAVQAISLVRLKMQTVGTVENAVASKVAAGAQKAWAAAQWLLNAAMDANPIGLVVVAVAALVVGMVIAYKKSATFRAIVQGAFHAVLAAAQKVGSFFTRDIPHAFDKVKSAASSALGWVKSHWPLILAILVGPFGLAVFAIAKNWDKIKAGASNVVGWFKQLPGKMGAALSSLASTLFHVVTGAFVKLGDAERTGIGKAISLVKSLPGKIKSAIGNLGSLLLGVGGQIIQGLIDGISNKIGDLKGLLGKVTNLIPSWKGPMEKDRILLKPAGVAIMEGLISGIGSKQVALQGVLSKVTASVQAAGQKLQAAISARNSFAQGFDGFSTSVFGADYGTKKNGNAVKPTIDAILAAQRAQAKQAQKVKHDVRKLVKMGLSPALIKQLQAQGAAGLPEIEALAHGSKADIRRLNNLNKQTSSDLHSAGMAAGNRLYGQQIAQDRRHYDDEKKLLGEIRDLLKREHHAGHQVSELRIEGHTLVAFLKKVKRTTGADATP